MAGLLGNSLGLGIGLQAGMDNTGSQLAAKGLELAAEKRKQYRDLQLKQLDKANEDYQSILKDVSPPKELDPLEQKRVQEQGAKLISRMQELHKENPYSDIRNNEEFRKGIFDLKNTFTSSVKNTAVLKTVGDFLRTAEDDPAKFDINKENRAIYDKAYETGDISLLEKIKTPDGTPVVKDRNINPSALASALASKKKYDWGKNLKPAGYELVYETNKTATPGAEYITTQDNKLVNKTKTMDVIYNRLQHKTDQVAQAVLEENNGDYEKAANDIFNTMIPKESRKTSIHKDFTSSGKQAQLRGNINVDARQDESGNWTVAFLDKNQSKRGTDDNPATKFSDYHNNQVEGWPTRITPDNNLILDVVDVPAFTDKTTGEKHNATYKEAKIPLTPDNDQKFKTAYGFNYSEVVQDVKIPGLKVSRTPYQKAKEEEATKEKEASKPKEVKMPDITKEEYKKLDKGDKYYFNGKVHIKK